MWLGSLTPEELKERTECLKCLYSSDYTAHKKRNPERAPGTCQWFLKHPKYQRWRQKPKSDLLWVSGDPGCGKSVLASFIVDELNDKASQHPPRDTACFFFFKDDNDEQKSAISGLRAILHQLLTAKPSLIRHALNDYRSKGKRFATELHTLWRVLTTVTSDALCGNVFCIIDGLDECEELTMNELLREMVNHYSTPSCKQTYLKFLALSRPYLSIQDEFENLQEVRLKTEVELDSIGDDIELVVRHKIKTLGKKRSLGEALQEDLINRLIYNSDRTFLWVALVLEEMEKAIRVSQKALEDLLDTLPKSLNATYEKILNRSQCPEDARMVLHIIVAAVRPLLLNEINTAFSIKPSDRTPNDICLEPSIGDTIKNLCGMFVRVIDSQVFLVHSTAREFLVQKKEQETLKVTKTSTEWRYSLAPSDSHLVLAERCLWSLSASKFDADWQHDPFFLYAAEQWPTHFRQAKGEEHSGALELAAKICSTCSTGKWFKKWWRFNVFDGHHLSPYQSSPEGLSDLILTSLLGIKPLVKLKLQTDKDLRSKDNRGFSALCWAVRCGHTPIVAMLLEAGANVNHRNPKEGCPLLIAAGRGFADILELLLAAGADPESENDDKETSLMRSLKRGHKDIALMLLDTGANIYHQCSKQRTSLHLAAQQGFVDVVKLLLYAGADIECEDQAGETPLQCSMLFGRQEITVMLLAAGASVNHRDRAQKTPLHLAAVLEDRVDIVRLLLKAGADIECENGIGETPLLGSLRYGNREIAGFLLDAGANVHHKSTKQRTPLHWAVQQGFVDVVQALLQRGADPNCRDRHDITPLMHAVCDELLARLLLDYGAKINDISGTGKTPLTMALGDRSDNKNVVELFLVRGADVNFKDVNVQNPLIVAIRSGWDVVLIEMLVEKGADLNPTSSNAWTPLHFAAMHGSLDVARLLLERGADVNSNTFRETPLHCALERHHLDVARLLLGKGANTNAEMKFRWTPLHSAAEKYQLDVARMLLEEGADVDAEDEQGKTPLATCLRWTDFGLPNATKSMVVLFLEFGASPRNLENRARATLEKLMAMS